MTYQKAVTSTQYYDEIAKKIQLYGDVKVYTPAQMPNAIDDIVSDAMEMGESYGYQEGYGKGLVDGEAQGRQAQYDEFWDSLVPEGKFNYQYAFGGARWSDATFKPTRPLVGSNFLRCFAESGIKTIGQTIDASGATSSTALQNMFYNADIETISKMVVSESTTFDSTTFRGCSALVTLNINGTIGKNGFDLRYATYLSANSILSVLNACNKENSGITITLPTRCIDNKTDTLTYIKANFLEEYERVTNEVYNYDIGFAVA